jgi:hypothetical protein
MRAHVALEQPSLTDPGAGSGTVAATGILASGGLGEASTDWIICLRLRPFKVAGTSFDNVR